MADSRINKSALGPREKAFIAQYRQNNTVADSLENDPRYKSIVEQLEQEWLEKHPGQDLLSEEGQNYRLGYQDLARRNAPTIRSEAMARMIDNHRQTVNYYKTIEKIKVYPDPMQDPSYREILNKIDQAIDEEKKVNRYQLDKDRFDRAIDSPERLWADYAKRFPEKTDAYKKNNIYLQRATQKQSPQAVSQKTERTIKTEAPTGQGTPLPPPPAQIQTSSGVSIPRVPNIPGQAQVGQAVTSRVPALGKVGNAINSVKSAVGNFAKKILSPITKAIGSLAAKLGIANAIGSILPGIGNAIATALTILSIIKPKDIVSAIGSGIMLIGSLFGAAVTNALGAALTAAGISVLILIPTIALIMFIINSGAYIVPPSSTIQGSSPGAACGSLGDLVPQDTTPSSCPVPEGFVSCGSYGYPGAACPASCAGGSVTGKSGHGGNCYWASNPTCDYAIPTIDTRPGPGGRYCSRSTDPDNVCYDKDSLCSWYGYAGDFTYSDLNSKGSINCLPVYLPTIEGQIVNWEVENGFQGYQADRGGYAILKTQVNGKVYEMYMLHLDAVPNGGQSGQLAGTLFEGFHKPGRDGRHVHIELRVNGNYLRPDYMCSGPL